MFKFRVQNSPLTPVEQGHDARDDYQSSPSSSTASRDSQGSGRTGKLGSRRRRSRGTTSKTIEKRPYHSPTHVSPPHDKPMTKNDMYFALDCEVRTWLVCLNIVDFDLRSVPLTSPCCSSLGLKDGGSGTRGPRFGSCESSDGKLGRRSRPGHICQGRACY